MFYPMLVQDYRPEKLFFPCYGQPKLDGLRCICYFAENRIHLISRGGHEFTSCPHIIEELFSFLSQFQNIVLDGELYSNTLPFPTLCGLVKRTKKQDIQQTREHVSFHCFDIISDMDFETRFVFSELQSRPFQYVKWVSTFLISNVEEIDFYFSQCLQNGYEGMILRNRHGKYEMKKRSFHVQKLKNMKEDEFIIVGYNQGQGRDEGTVIWECSVDNQTFHVRPMGTLEERQLLFQNAADYIGQPLTVIYQELTPKGIPRFPVGKCIRFD